MSFATATGVHASLQSAAIAGAGARPVEVQVDLALGLPGFHLVGLPDHACNDARTRVLTAVRNSGYQLPQKKITVNLAPGDLRKQGVAFDLPIAVGILVAAGLVPLPERPPLVVGELALSGEVLPVRGVLPIGLEARRLGFAEGIGLSSDGTLSEGSGENLFLVKDGVLLTPALAHSVLGGLTRDTVMRLARERGLEVRECALPRELLYLADEAFFTGTAVEITAIRSVDRLTIGSGKRGPVTETLQNAFFGLFSGKTADKWGWLDYVDMSVPRVAASG